MAEKDYYDILGVSPTATPQSIQRAFRALAKQYHPDRVGDQGTSAFQDIVEAYQVLSDPERRASYDHRLRSAATTARSQSQPEPLVPEPAPYRQPLRHAPLRPAQLSLLSDFLTIRPSFEALRARMLRNYPDLGVPRGERVESVNVEIVLSPDEARRGGVLHLGVPVAVPCPRCMGRTYAWGMSCSACMGQGMIAREIPVAVRIPPRVRHGTVLERPLHALGLPNCSLCMHIAVSTWG